MPHRLASITPCLRNRGVPVARLLGLTATIERLAADGVIARATAVRAARHHDLSTTDLDTTEQNWEQRWAAVRPVKLTAAVERHGGN